MKGSAASPMTPDPGTHPSSVPASGNLLLNPSVALTAAPSARDPILLTQRQFQILRNTGMLSNGGGLEPSTLSPRSPSINSTNHEHVQPTQTQDNSQHTYIYETLNHDGLVEFAQKEFSLDVQGCSTQAIIHQLRVAKAEQASADGTLWHPPLIVVLPPVPLRVGGGWSQEVLGGLGSTTSLSSKKCLSTSLVTSNSSSKRQRTTIEVSDDTATKPESDNEPIKLPQHSTHGPPLSRIPMATTILETQPSNASSHLLDGLTPAQKAPKLPNMTYLTSGPVHSHAHAKLLQRFLNYPIDPAEADKPQPVNIDEVLETGLGWTPNSPESAAYRLLSNQYTYKGYRSHVPSKPEASHVNSPGTNDTTKVPNRPDPPCITPSQWVQQERARAIAAKVQAELTSMASTRRLHIFSSASKPPASRPQPHPPLGSKGNTVGHRMGASRRLDPASAARADMVEFNRAVAQGQATSFVKSITQQSKRTADCGAPKSRPLDGLLEDDEEMLVQAKALAKGKWPHTLHVCKPKPLQRDVSGIERQVLIMAKIHLFAYTLVEGVYQTRTTFLRWASAVHEATWQMELPDRPYEKPSDEIFEIMVNNIATLRGKAKERLREFVTRVSGFQQNVQDQNAIQNNLKRFNELYPNSYHCWSSNPREGDYEHPELGHCISLAIFHGANLVGVLYSDYFRDVPLPVVAFCLAMWQFCIEEWANGWHQNGDLGMGVMREKYEAQLAGLKELHEVAPRRMNRLQDEWRDYAAGYSGAVFVSDEADNTPAHKLQMRPNTPEPDDAISVEEAQMLETARQESLREQQLALAAQELEEDEEEGSDVPALKAPNPRIASVIVYLLCLIHAESFREYTCSFIYFLLCPHELPA
ncbi:hypothetical protein OPQ81_012015 [Rhizoctonia solani]|nr:hypothetical protein OPQ81_012015 [Rhizoctonia solani]